MSDLTLLGAGIVGLVAIWGFVSSWPLYATIPLAVLAVVLVFAEGEELD